MNPYQGALAATHSYIARRSCGCICWAVLDNPADRAWVARQVAEMIRDGHTPERLSQQGARESPWECDRCRWAEPVVGQEALAL